MSLQQFLSKFYSSVGQNHGHFTTVVKEEVFRSKLNVQAIHDIL